MGLQSLSEDILNIVVEHLVIDIGIQRAVLLRNVNKAMNAAILQAICVSQVIDIEDPATPNVSGRIAKSLRKKIIAVKSRFADVEGTGYVSVVAKVNQTLDSIFGASDKTLVRSRHQSVAGAIILSDEESIDTQVEAQNLLSGAVIVGNLTLIKSLLDHGTFSSTAADINGHTPYFHSPLALAAAEGHLAVVCYLLECGARLDSVSRFWYEHRKPLDREQWNSQDEEIRCLSLNQHPPSALRVAVLGGHREVVHVLLRPQYRLPITSLEYLRAILAGARAGRPDFIELLFNVIGKDLSDFPYLGKEMIWTAIRYDQKEVVQMLMANGVDVNAFPDRDTREYYGTLHIAASLGNFSMVRFLIERGADVHSNGSGRDGNLPIEAAARCGQDEVVTLLIEQGADPVKAFQSAAGGGQTRTLRYLLNKYPDLPYRQGGDIGRAALYRALMARNLTSMSILAEAGVPLNYGYEFLGGLPLDIAKMGSGQWVVNHLISIGAHETDREVDLRVRKSTIRGIHVSERTWEWVSK